MGDAAASQTGVSPTSPSSFNVRFRSSAFPFSRCAVPILLLSENPACSTAAHCASSFPGSICESPSPLSLFVKPSLSRPPTRSPSHERTGPPYFVIVSLAILFLFGSCFPLPAPNLFFQRELSTPAAHTKQHSISSNHPVSKIFLFTVRPVLLSSHPRTSRYRSTKASLLPVHQDLAS